MNGQNFFDQPVKSDMRTYDNIRKIATDQRDDYTNGCLLDYPYFKDYYKMRAIDLSKQQVLDADSEEILYFDFPRNLNRKGGVKMLFNIEEAKETILDFS